MEKSPVYVPGPDAKRKVTSDFISFTVNVDSVNHDAITFSPTTMVGGIPWAIGVTRRIGDWDDEEHLAVFVYCNWKNESTLWSCKADMKIKLHTIRGSGCERGQSDVICFNAVGNKFGGDFLLWSSLEDPDNGYLDGDGQFVVEAEIRIYSTDGYSVSNDQHTDIILVNGESINVNKYILAGNSPYFQQFFFGEHSNKPVNGQFELSDSKDNAQVFRQMLEIIDPWHVSNKYPINLDNVEQLLEHASRYQMYKIIKKCEIYLLSTGDKNWLMKKLALADRFKLPELESQCVKWFSSLPLGVLKSERCKVGSEFNTLSARCKALLLDKYTGDDCRPPRPPRNRSYQNNKKKKQHLAHPEPLCDVVQRLPAVRSSWPSDGGGGGGGIREFDRASSPTNGYQKRGDFDGYNRSYSPPMKDGGWRRSS